MREALARTIIELILRYGSIGLEELSKLAHTRRLIAQQIVSSLPGVVVEGDTVKVEEKLKLVLYALLLGLPVKRVSQYIDWRDFEKVSASILRTHGYIVETNILFTKPRRFEIDVLGVDMGSGRAIVVDCKHWKHGISPSSIIEAGRRHIDRTIKLLKYRSWIERRLPIVNRITHAVPLLVTLTTPRIRSVDKRVIVVSISELNNLLLDLHLVMETLNVKPITLAEALDKNKTLF